MLVETKISSFRIVIKDKDGEEIGLANVMCDSEGGPDGVEITVLDGDYEAVIDAYNMGDDTDTAIANLEAMYKTMGTLITELKKHQMSIQEQEEWININNKKLPKPGTIILAVVQHFGTKKTLQVELKRVKEDDVCFRTTDDNSELDENNWNILKYKVIK